MGGGKLFEIFGEEGLQVECKVVHLDLDVGGVGLLHWGLKWRLIMRVEWVEGCMGGYLDRLDWNRR
jgi:hypothetical protein